MVHRSTQSSAICNKRIEKISTEETGERPGVANMGGKTREARLVVRTCRLQSPDQFLSMLPLSGPLGSIRIFNSSNVRKTGLSDFGNTNHVMKLGREKKEPCSADGNIQIPEQWCCKTPPKRFFKKNGERTRGHCQKLLKNLARLGQKKNFFPVKIVGKGNDLPANLVEAATIGSFKRRLMNLRRSLVTS